MTIAVSVVIPTYRRPHLLYRCLLSLLHQTLDAEAFEVIVVDDGRDGLTREVVARVAARRPVHPSVRYLTPPDGARGPAVSRNRGWRAASGDIVAFTDDDTVPQPGWLAEGVRAVAANVDAAAGRVQVPIPLEPTDYQRNVKRLEDAEFVTANCFVRRATLARIGGFDERFTRAWREDSDLHFSLLEQRARLVRAPCAVVLHPVREAAWGVSLKEQRNMLFDALLFKKHPRLYRERIRSRPPLRYYATVLALLLAPAAAFAGERQFARGAAATWLLLTAAFCLRRLAGASREPRHVLEMIATSVAIPVAAVYWRLAGALRFRCRFG
jgi:glycosyltransferase involved in cell wall biosynthesis